MLNPEKYALVVEDDELLREMIGIVLSEEMSYEGASDGMEALEFLNQAQRKPQLVLTDMKMPRLDGWGLIEAIRQREDWNDIPIIGLSASVNYPDDIEALGLSAWIIKPFDIDKFLDTVRGVLLRKPTPEELLTPPAYNPKVPVFA